MFICGISIKFDDFERWISLLEGLLNKKIESFIMSKKLLKSIFLPWEKIANF